MNDRLTNAEKSTRYTAVFEFEGQPPAVHVACGWLGGRLVAVSFEDELARIDFADALLAAAGEKDDPLTRMDEVRRLKDLLAACERERDALKAETEVHYPEVCEQYEAEIERLQAANDDHEAKIAALKRRLEPLTEDEMAVVACTLIGGGATFTGDPSDLVKVFADEIDLIRARRA